MDTWKERKLVDLKNFLRNKSQELWENLEEMYEPTPQTYYIPLDNIEEARERIRFVDKILKTHEKMFNSRWPVDYLYGNLQRHLKAMQPNQMRMDGVLDNQEQEIKEIRILMNEVLKNPRWFFDEPHHVGCRHFFSK